MTMNRMRWPSWPLRLAGIFALALLSQCLLIVPAAQAATDGVVTGTVINATTDAPLENATVTLARFASTTSIESVDVTATTDADGTFTFADLDTADGFRYMAAVEYSGVVYRSSILDLTAAPTLSVDLTVYDTTTDASVLSALSRGIIVTGIDEELGIMTVTDVTAFEVSGNRTYIGAEASRTAIFTVPADALQVSPRPGFDFGSPIIENNVVFATGPMLPGSSTASIDYELPYTGARRSLDIVGDTPTAFLQVLLPEALADGDLSLEGPTGLIGGDTLELGDAAYARWAFPELAQGDDISLTITGLPRPEVAQRSLRTLTPLLVAIAIVIAAAALTVYALRSRRLTRSGVSEGPGQTEALRIERERIANELRSLETAWQAGDVDEDRYRDERLLILQELRTAARLERQSAEPG